MSYITLCQTPRNILICTKSEYSSNVKYICVPDGKLWHGNRLHRNYAWSSFFFYKTWGCFSSCHVLSFRNFLWQVSIFIKMLIFHKMLHTLQTRTLKISLSIFLYKQSTRRQTTSMELELGPNPLKYYLSSNIFSHLPAKWCVRTLWGCGEENF